MPDDWTEEDGGALDLFSLADPRDPTIPGVVARLVVFSLWGSGQVSSILSLWGGDQVVA